MKQTDEKQKNKLNKRDAIRYGSRTTNETKLDDKRKETDRKQNNKRDNTDDKRYVTCDS